MFRGRVLLLLVTSVVLLIWILNSNKMTQNKRVANQAERQTWDYKGSAIELISEEQREFLWKTEHYGNALTRYGFEPLAKRISESDKVGIAKVLTSEFQAQAFTYSAPLSHQNRQLEITRQSHPEHLRSVLNGEQFVEWLIGQIANFHKKPKVRFHLMALQPIDGKTIVPEKWTATAKLRIWGESEPGSPHEILAYFDLTTGKLENKVLSDSAWLSELNFSLIQTARSKGFLMKEVTGERGVKTADMHDNWNLSQKKMVGNSGGVYLSDYNRDGYMDMLVTDIKGPNKLILYQGAENGRMTDVTADVGLHSSHAGFVSFLDVDDDGWEDLIHMWKNSPDGCRIYRNQEGRHFADATHLSNLPQLIASVGKENVPTGFSLADFDKDGYVDLYVTRSAGFSFKTGSWIDGHSGTESANQLIRNLGGGRFEDLTQSYHADGDHRSTAGAVWFDADLDGWPDLFVPDEFGNGLLLVNVNGKDFKPVKLTEGPSDWGTMGITCGDFDNDGLVDIYVNNMYSKAGKRVMGNIPPGSYPDEIMQKLKSLVDGSELYRNTGGLNFEKMAQGLYIDAVGWGWGPGMFDLNNDGFLDIYANCGFISQDRSKPDG